MTAKVSSWPYGKPFPPHDIEAKFAAAKARISELEESEAGLVAELAESKRAHEQRDEIDACSNRRIVDREAERVELVAMLERLADTSEEAAFVALFDDARALLARLKGGG